MKVNKFLKKYAVKMGIIKLVEEVNKVELPQVETKSVSLGQLQIELEEDRKRKISGHAPELSGSFNEIFQSFKIPIPSHGWNVDKILETLKSDQFKSLDQNTVKQSLLVLLKNNNVPIEDIVKDALLRDKALDSYERFAYNKLQERINVRKDEAGKIEQEIKDCQRRIDYIESLQAKDKTAFSMWLKKKVEKEVELVHAVVLIASAQGISVGPVVGEKIKD